MSAGYQTLHVGKNGALALAAITGWQVSMPLVPLWSMLIASKLVKCCMVWLWHSGAPYAFAVLQFFFREKKRQNLPSLIATLWCVCGQLSAFIIITPVILNELLSQLLD